MGEKDTNVQEQKPQQNVTPQIDKRPAEKKYALPLILIAVPLVIVFAIALANLTAKEISGVSERPNLEKPAVPLKSAENLPQQMAETEEMAQQEIAEGASGEEAAPPATPEAKPVETPQDLSPDLSTVAKGESTLANVEAKLQTYTDLSSEAKPEPYTEVAKEEAPPSDVKGYFQRGENYYYKGEFDNAINDFKKAIELDPKYADAYCEMGVSYMEKNDWDTAINMLSKCIEMDPNHPKAQYAIAVSYARMPEPDLKLAREHFEISKKLGFMYPQWFEDFLKRLEAGERFPGQEGAAKQ